MIEPLKTNNYIPSSFRDPSGFLFYLNGTVYRQVNNDYREDYEHLINSGLCEKLVDTELLIPHEEVKLEIKKNGKAYKIIKPELIEFISYPYEWCFSQLKDAALTTLKIQRKSLEFGMSLKDGSAYNIQFRKGKPIFIDTLSFERYKEGQYWVAYRQFCQHFLVPLALMSYTDVRLNRLLQIYLDGIPLDIASKLLPFRTYFILSLLSHIHLHAKSQKYFADKIINITTHKMSRLSFIGLIENLESTVNNLSWNPKGTEWANYYRDTNYSMNSIQHKKQLLTKFLDSINPTSVWDLGANIGIFSRIASNKGIPTISFDIDPAAVEINYNECIEKGEINILPLVLDLTNPSPNIGWKNEERMSLQERGPADTVFALALIHHLAISNNLPFYKIAEFFIDICDTLIIEFVPKNDSQVKLLLSTRKDIFPDYNQRFFKREFERYFKILKYAKIKDSERTLYLMKRKNI